MAPDKKEKSHANSRKSTSTDVSVFPSHLGEKENGMKSPKNLLTVCQMANYNRNMVDSSNNFGRIIKQQRIALQLTLQQLADKSGVSPSHLGRIERGQRFPSAHILRKIAKPLGFDEDELFTLAGYLSSDTLSVAEKTPVYSGGRLDPYVASVLSQEPAEVQRAVIGILTMLKNIARSIKE